MTASLYATALTLGTGTTVLLWVLGGLLLSGLLLWIVSFFVASYFVYDRTLRRRSEEQWGRHPSEMSEEHLKMDAEGMRWQEKHAACKHDVHILHNGLNLYGEYYDLGYDRCVMILSGRTESLRYGYYFASPYAAAGYNVLVFDPRAHGLSDGVFNTVGFEESGDALAWAAYLHDELGMRSILFHGICIGAAGGMLAITREDCPDYIEGLVADGMFANFGESMKNHLIERKKPVRVMYRLINGWMKHYTGHSMDHGPIDVIHKMNKPLLMLYSREDLYSRPDFAKKLFDLAASKQKKLVWFEHGAHSMLRLTDTKKYDEAITAFLTECFSPVAK